MKKIILAAVLTLSTSFYSFAENWQDKWSEFALLMEKNHFNEAMLPLNEAISLMESENISEAYLYVDRARLNLALKENDNVLADIEKALSCSYLGLNEKVRAITTKIMACSRLGDTDSVIDDLKNFEDLTFMPSIEIKDSKLLIRNAPNSEYYRKLMTCYLVHSGVCYDKDEFVWINSSMLVAEKINHCGCQKCIAEYAKTRDCDACLKVMSPSKQNVSLDDLIIAAIKYCGREVKQLEDQKAYLTALIHIQHLKTGIELFDGTFDAIFEGIDRSNAIFFD
jgi:hypothetical protein